MSTGRAVPPLEISVAGNVVIHVPEGYRVAYRRLDGDHASGEFRYPSGVIYNGTYELKVVERAVRTCSECGDIHEDRHDDVVGGDA